LTDFDEALVDYLLGQPGIAALAAKRIYPDYFPQSEQLPAIAHSFKVSFSALNRYILKKRTLGQYSPAAAGARAEISACRLHGVDFLLEA
jgi:hypothetical protein